jgi:hypothetical protein
MQVISESCPINSCVSIDYDSRREREYDSLLMYLLPAFCGSGVAAAAVIACGKMKRVQQMNERERSLSLGNQLVSTDEKNCRRLQNIRHRERESMSPAPALSSFCLPHVFYTLLQPVIDLCIPRYSIVSSFPHASDTNHQSELDLCIPQSCIVSSLPHV